MQAAGHGPLEHVPTTLSSEQCFEEDLLEPFSNLPLIPCLSSDDLQFLEALHSEGHLCAPTAKSEVSLETHGIPLGLDARSRVQASRRQMLTALDLGRPQEDQVVPTENPASSSFGSALPGRPPPQASSCSQVPDEQGLARGWEMHRELLLKRAAHQRALQNSSIGLPLSCQSQGCRSDSIQRDRSASCKPTASQLPDLQEDPLQRRRTIMRKLPGGISVRYHPGARRPGQQQRGKQAVQSKVRLPSAQEAEAFEPRNNSSASQEDPKRGRDSHPNTLLSQHDEYRLVPTAGFPSKGFPNPHQHSHAVPRASTVARSKQTAQWQSLGARQCEQAEAPSAPSAKRVQCSQVASEKAKEAPVSCITSQ